MAPRTILYLANSEKIGGGNQVLMSLVDGLDPARFRSVVVAPRAGALTEWAVARGVPSHVVSDDSSSRSAFARRVLALTTLFWQEHVDIVHAHSPWIYRAAGLAGRCAGAKRICHVHFPLSWPELRWHVRFGVDAVVTCYAALARELADGARDGLRAPFVAIPNTVDDRRFTPLAPDADQTRERWRHGADQLIVIVGHLSEVKGYPTFLRAAARLRAAFPRCRFVAVGGETLVPGYGAELQRLAASLGIADAVAFLGWRTDVPDILRACDVMVLPSRAEGLPLAVLEAMACGVPVVASAVNGTPEAVVHGETGFLVPPDDPAALTASIAEILRDAALRARMAAAARRRVEEQFTLPRFLDRVGALYDELTTPALAVA